MICFITGRGYEMTLAPLRRDRAAPDIQVYHYEGLSSQRTLPRATYIFTEIDRLNTNALIDAARLYRRLREQGCRVLNDPARVRTRGSLLPALFAAGMNPIDAWWVDEDRAPLRFPVFIRVANTHEGPLSDLIWSAEDLSRAVDAAILAGYPRSTLMVVEYAAQEFAPGLFRKGSVYRIGERYIVDLWTYARSWSVKADRRDIVEGRDSVGELAMMRANAYPPEAEAAFALAEIEYGRLDFGIVDGRFCVYEINTNPELFGIRADSVSERGETVGIKWRSQLSGFREVDTDTALARDKVEATGASLEALTAARDVYPLPSIELGLGAELARRGDRAAALKAAEDALTTSPGSVHALSAAGRARARAGRVDQAIAALESVLAASPRRRRDRALLAVLLLKAGRPGAALRQIAGLGVHRSLAQTWAFLCRSLAVRLRRPKF
jgi:tetratricopeptide (TPR) repeat protein